MFKKAILFDLDGTLTDSGEGIINCVTLALNHFHLPVPDRETLRVFVGPPLRDSFIKFGVPEAEVEEAIRVFRSRYLPVGIFENYPYPGIREMLEKLKAQGHILYVATSKPESMAKQVLEHFDLERYFDLVCGSMLEKGRDNKDAVIAYLLEQCTDVSAAIMVGDTKFDVLGANAHGIPTIGVSWGYGKAEDMINAGAKSIADSPEMLFELLQA